MSRAFLSFKSFPHPEKTGGAWRQGGNHFLGSDLISVGTYLTDLSGSGSRRPPFRLASRFQVVFLFVQGLWTRQLQKEISLQK